MDAIEIMSTSLADVYRHDDIDDMALEAFGGMQGSRRDKALSHGMPRIPGGRKLASLSKTKRCEFASRLDNWIEEI